MTSAISETIIHTPFQEAPSAIWIKVQVEKLQSALNRCDWKTASEECISLVDQGRRLVALQVRQDRTFDPMPMTLDLVEALNSPKIQWQDNVTYHIARATRLFMELACMKRVLDNKPVRRDTQESLRGALDTVIDHFKNQPTLLYELKCTSEALKLMEETDTKGYLTSLFSAVTDPGITSVLTLLGLLPGLITKKSNDWFSEALFLSWMGGFARDDKKLFISLRETLQANIETLEIAQTGVEFFADIIWHGSPELQWEALTGEVGLITLLHQERPRNKFNVKYGQGMWPVRYRTIQLFVTLMHHSNPKIAEQAMQALFQRSWQESNPKVQELLKTIQKDPSIQKSWRLQFTQQEQRIFAENIREKEEFEKLESQLIQKEQDLANAHEVNREQQEALAQERQYVEELRQESQAHRDNAEALHLQFMKGVNVLIDDMLVREVPKAHLEDIPQHLCCPITLGLMHDPVIAEDGRTYERSAIEKWFKTSTKSPITGASLISTKLTPNRAIKDALETYRKGSGQTAESSDVHDVYMNHLLALVDNPLILAVPTLAALLNQELAALMDSNDAGLTPKQRDSYKWVQKLIIEGRISNPIMRKLHQIHGLPLPVPSSPQPSTKVITPAEELQLAEDYILGENGKPQNIDLGIEYIKKSAAAGNPTAQLYMGCLCDERRGKALELRKILDAKRSRGSRKHHVYLMFFDHSSSYHLRNNLEVVIWLRKAADQGYAEAQNNLGGCYYEGRGVDKDFAEAVKWYRKAADQGYADAQNSLGLCYDKGEGVSKDFAEAVKWWRKAADQSLAVAQSSLGLCYYNGQGVDKDFAEAVKWWRKAADQGYAGAQSSLGLCYYNGQGVDKDFAEAVKWYRKAADQGSAVAQCNLGTCYYEGNGVSKDFAEAVKWWRKAADQSLAVAQSSLGLCYYNGQGVDKDFAEAVKWLKKAADQGNADAQTNLKLWASPR